MDLPKNMIEIKCPACNQIFYTKKSSQTACYYCKSIIELDKDRDVVGYEPPESHRTALVFLVMISVSLLVIILVDALVSENTVQKLMVVGAVIVMVPMTYFWFPIRHRVGRKYIRFGLMIGVTLILFLLLVINLGNLFFY